MTVGHALQDVSEPGKGLDIVEFCGGDNGADGGPPDAATVGACEQVVFASECDGPEWRSRPGCCPVRCDRLPETIQGQHHPLSEPFRMLNGSLRGKGFANIFSNRLPLTTIEISATLETISLLSGKIQPQFG